MPTKTSDLSNDAGFITSADIHNDYIEDINGSSISADRSFVTVTQLSGVWQLQYGATTNTLQGQSKTSMSYYPDEPELGGNAFQLSWGVHSSEHWTLEVYTYNGGWTQTGQYDSEPATSAATELVFPDSSVRECIYEETTTIETGKLAKESDLPTKTSDLSNDSGFITSADLSVLHQDYIIDGAGKSISADGRTVVDRDEPSYWVLTFNHEQYQLSGAKGSASYYPSTSPYYDGQFKGELNWSAQ